MADPVTAIALASAAFGAYQQYQTGKRQERYQRQLEREMAISPEEARQYNELVAQLAWMAGLDPTQFYVQPTGPFEGRTVDLPAPVASTPFRAIDPEAIDEVIAQTQRDLATQAGTLGEPGLALGIAARRDLAAPSLVGQRHAHIGTEMGRELSRARTEAELEAEALPRRYADRPLQMLMGLNPNDLAAIQTATEAYQALLNQLAQQQAGWGQLTSTGVQYFMPRFEQWLAQQTQPTATTDDQWKLKISYNPFQ